MNRVTAVNRALRARGISATLRRGREYYYFFGPATTGLPETSVYVNRADTLTVEEWLEVFATLSAAKGSLAWR